MNEPRVGEMPDKDNERVREEGLADGRAGKAAAENPHLSNTVRFDRWMDGWYDAQIERRRLS